MRCSKVLSSDEVQQIVEALQSSDNPVLNNLAKELFNEQDVAIAILEEDEL